MRRALIAVVASAVGGLLLVGCSPAGEEPAQAPPSAEPSTTPAPKPTVKSEPAAEELEWPDDPDQRRFYEGVRGAAGWEESSATELDELGVATCRDLRGYSGDPALAVASMEAAYIENLGVEHGAAKGIVAAAIARWCPEVAG